MAQRDLTVRLRADIGQYRAAMADASKSTDSVARAGQALQNVGGKISSVGDNLTKKVTVPLALAGAAAVKMAGDFDATFTQMQTLAGLSAGEVDGLKDSVLDLAGETGKAPQELAEALYFLRSSGLDASGAMDALEVSAKASAAGLGDTVVLADAVSSAMMAYSEAGLTAADATDVLVATARAGKAEPSELAGQLGRLIPISAELGISFADVGGAIAALSTKGNDAASASTQLLGVMSKLLKPSQQAAEQLDEVGLSTDAVRQMIAEKGLLGTLEELRATLGENGFIKFLEDQQAVQGGLALLGGDLEKTKGIFEDVNDAAGATDEAFATWAESMGAKNAQAFAQFQVALIRVGETIAPIASDVLNAVSSIAEAFSGLPDGAQKAILAVAGIAAATGPLLSIGGRLVAVWGGVMKLWSGLQAWTAPAKAIEGAFNTAGRSADDLTGRVGRLGQAARLAAGVAGIAGLAAAIHELRQAEIDADIAQLSEEFLAGADAAEQLRGTLDSGDWGPFTTGGDATRVVGEFGRLLETSTESASRFVDQLERAGASGDVIDQMRDAIERKAAADRQAAADADASSAAVDGQAASMDEAAASTDAATSSLQEYSDALKAQTDPIFAAMDAINGNRDAQVAYQDALIGVQEAQAALDEAIEQHGAKSAEAADAQRNLEDAQRGVTDAQWGTVTSAYEADTALAALKDAADRGDVSMSAFRDTLQVWVAQGFITQGQADAAAFSIGGLSNAADDADSKRVDIPVGAPGAPRSRSELWAVRDAALDADRQSPTVTTSTLGTGSARNALWSVRDAVFSIPTSRTINIHAAIDRLAFGWVGKAKGGPVMGGQAYVVGEEGPELFIPKGNGTIVPNGPTGDLMAASSAGGGWGGWGPSAGGGGGGLTIAGNVTVVANDPQALVDGLVRWSRNNGPVPIRVGG